jgi:hypothetical protein
VRASSNRRRFAISVIGIPQKEHGTAYVGVVDYGRTALFDRQAPAGNGLAGGAKGI